MSDNGENKGNEVYKIATIIDHVRLEYTKKRLKKPTKWGFKNFVHSCSSGIMVDIFFYTGATSNR